ncbi:MAG: GMC family oxidoreductase, partial [Parvularcula sp.]|nr:GMC family oxidoreductase [Parvularcula sp.]
SAKDGADVVIVGAGMAGAVYAATLAKAGKSVLVLEAGGDRRLDDLVSSQIWARRLKWSGSPVLFEGNHIFGHATNTGSGRGGAALHHYATWPRFHEDIFRLKSTYGRGLDWPLEYADLRPYYDLVQAEVGISGDAEAEPWRPEGAPYPHPPLMVFGQGRAIARGFEKKGMALSPLPAAILTEPRGDRLPCAYDGWCDAGCPIGSLANPLVTYLAEAEKAGARVVLRRRVTRIVNEGGRSKAVAWVDESGAKGESEAGVVVLAASAVQNPRILMNSPDAREPDRAIGDRAGLLGRYFMLDSLAIVYGLFPEDETQPHLGVSAGQLMHRGVHQAEGRPFGGYQWQVAPAMKPNDIFGIAVSRADMFGTDLDQFLKRAVRHIGSAVGMVEELPRYENRVELSAERDPFGMPLARVVHSFDEDARALNAHVQNEGIEIMKAAGASDAWTGAAASGHLTGGTIFGDSIETSVCDSFGRIHDMDNLFVAGAGLFPGSGGISPTYTVTSLSLRNAEAVAKGWADYVN